MQSSPNVIFGFEKSNSWGHVVNQEGIMVDLAKIEAVIKWEQSKSPTEIRSFLGLVGYY